MRSLIAIAILAILLSQAGAVCIGPDGMPAICPAAPPAHVTGQRTPEEKKAMIDEHIRKGIAGRVRYEDLYPHPK